MEKVCPICNGLNKTYLKCEKCGDNMINAGLIQDYFDDYSAEMEILDDESFCYHIYKCNKCGYYERKKIQKVKV